jgi:hypothetical protein
MDMFQAMKTNLQNVSTMAAAVFHVIDGHGSHISQALDVVDDNSDI